MINWFFSKIFQEAANENSEENLRPGDPGWCYRARVPQPMSNAYVNRPKWSSEVDMSHKKQKNHGRLDKYMKQQGDKKGQKHKTKRAVEISIEGRKMALWILFSFFLLYKKS